jgi:hypothetical protein
MQSSPPLDIAQARFGLRGNEEGQQKEEEEIVTPAMDRVEVKVTHAGGDGGEVTFTMRLEGMNVFQGMLEGIKSGWVDGRRCPSWLTGEEGSSEMRVVRVGDHFM